MATTGVTGHEGQPAHRGRVMTRLSQVFALDRKGVNVRRGLIILAIFFVPLIIAWAIGEEQYWLTATFSILFVCVADPGGSYRYRAWQMARVALIGAPLTALAFWIASTGWGWVVVATFVVTLAAGLAVKFGLRRFVDAMNLNIWFLIAITLPASDKAAHVTSHTWAQGVTWLAGGALWIALAFIAWLAGGREDRPAAVPEIPGDTSPRQLTKPLIAYATLRAIALAITVAIAFGLHLPNADWMPIAALFSIKPSLDQTALVAEQRLGGALIGATLAAVLLLTIKSKHALEVILIVLLALGASIRAVNYALYNAAIAAGVLIALDLPHPSNLSDEGQRVLFTFIGVGIGVILMLLAGLLAKRNAKAQPDPTSQPA